MRLTIGNARTTVDGLDRERKWLEEILTIDTGQPDIKRGGNILHRFYKAADTTFPSGLLVYVLRAECPSDVHLELVKSKTEIELPTEPVVPDGIEERDYQLEAVRQMLRHKRGLVHMATNSGKSLCAASFLKTVQPLGFRGMVLIHRREIFDQLLQTFKQHLGKGAVGALGQKRDEVRGKQFVVCMYQTLRNRIGADPDATRLYREHQLILLDEGHHLQASGLQELFLGSEAPLRFAMSGTIPEPYTYAGMLVRAHTGKVLVRVTNAELVERGVSAKPVMTAITFNWKSLFQGFYDRFVEEFSIRHPDYLPLFRGGRWRSKFVGYRFAAEYSVACFEHGVVKNQDRNAEIVRQVAKRDKQTLLITERIEHGENLAQAFEEAGHKAVFIHGQSKDRDKALKRFRAGKLRTLISSNILDEGIDVAGIELLVMAGVKKCKRAFLQRLGRGLRRKEGANVLELLDFLDMGNKYLEKYSLERRKVFKDEGFEVKED